MQQQTRGPCRIGATVIVALHVLCLHAGASAGHPGTRELLTALGDSTTTDTKQIVLFNGLVVLRGTDISGPSTDSSNRLLRQVRVDLSIPYSIVIGDGFDAHLRGQLLQSQTWAVDRLEASTPTNGRVILETLRDSDAQFASTYVIETDAVVALVYVGDAYDVSWQDVILGKEFDSDVSSQNFITHKLRPRVYHFGAFAPINGTTMLDALGHPSAWFDLRTGSTLLSRNQLNAAMANTGDVSLQVSSPFSLNPRSALIGQGAAPRSINIGMANVEGNDFTNMNGNSWHQGQRELVPEPAALTALGLGLSLIIARRLRH